MLAHEGPDLFWPHWLIDSRVFLFEEIHQSATEKEQIGPENVPPITLTPRGHGNIHTGEHYWLQVLYYVPSHSFLEL